MLRLRPGAASGVICLALAACAKNDTKPPHADTASAAATIPAPGARSAGVNFDPGAIRPGMRVGALVVESITATRTPVDSTYVGDAKFGGEIELTGWTLRHPDSDLQPVPVCFETDSASAARLPRWSGDERRPWFCFANRADAVRGLGAPSEGVAATIVIDRFTIHRGLSDQVNSARFVRLVRGGTGTTYTSQKRQAQH